jgi:hypothetical protein
MARQESGRRGGLATLACYDRPRMRAIGKRGFEATVARHWAGDRLAYRQYLTARQWNALAGLDVDRQIAAGAAGACVEPTYQDEGDEPPF